MAKNDGGPAFARGGCNWTEDHGDGAWSQEGMSLRDYFAAKAMQAAFSGAGARMVADRDSRYDETNWAQVVALNAYEMADAMLAQRQKPEDPDGK